VDGVTVPYRPVGIMAYHMAQQELGFQALRAMAMVAMLIGSVGAAGGTLTDFSWKVHKNWAGLDNIEITDSPNIYLNKSQFYPINSNNSSMVAKVLVDPDKYGVAEEKIPEMVIVHMANPLGSFPDREANFAAYEQLEYVVVIDPWLSATADLFADIVLPAATIEKYEGPLSANTPYEDATALRLPPMEPMFDSRGDIDIYLDLTEAAGILYGEEGYLAELNHELKLEVFALPLDDKPSVRGIFDRWAREHVSEEEGIAFFERQGVQYKGPIGATKRYGYAALDDEGRPFAGAYPHRLSRDAGQGRRRDLLAGLHAAADLAHAHVGRVAV
jgi:anaerobic selenocysteine-containing dehydrogenase